MEDNNTANTTNERLSYYQIFEIVNHPFGPNCPLQIKDNIDDNTLDQIPFFRICETFLHIIEREKQIKLTPLGALQKKILVEIYEHKFIAEDMIENGITKLNRELDATSIHNARIVCELAKLVKKRANKLSMTKKGALLIKDRNALFQLITKTFMLDFNWSYNDGYTDQPIAQYGALYTIHLLLTYGIETRPIQFYSDKYLEVFVNATDFFHDKLYSTTQDAFAQCFQIRYFRRFADWFAFTQTSTYNYKPNQIFTTKATPLLQQIFQYKAPM